MLDIVGVNRYNSGMVNRLAKDKQTRIIRMLVEGSSMRSITRIESCSLHTVNRLVEYAGQACMEFHHDRVRDVNARNVQADEVWSYIYAKNKNVEKAVAAPKEAGDVWTWTALDADTKLMITWAVSTTRDGQTAIELMDDLRSRTTDRLQLTTDGLKVYPEAVEGAFGGNIDYAQLIKLYAESTREESRRYSPSTCIGTKEGIVIGNPDKARISTSHVERSNLTLRMSLRRFTRLTNAFSKKFENHCYALALFFTYYNWVRPHSSLSKPYKTTPAMAAGLTDEVFSMEWLSALVSSQYPRPGPRGKYQAS